jgi:hypothetical protein
VIRIACLITLALLTGCVDPSPPQKSPPKWGNTFEFKLSDGTPCAVYEGSRGGGISCGWELRKRGVAVE